MNKFLVAFFLCAVSVQAFSSTTVEQVTNLLRSFGDKSFTEDGVRTYVRRFYEEDGVYTYTFTESEDSCSLTIDRNRSQEFKFSLTDKDCDGKLDRHRVFSNVMVNDRSMRFLYLKLLFKILNKHKRYELDEMPDLGELED